MTGVITRDSIRNALMKGITAEQIIYYMQSHAHAQMRKKVRLRIVSNQCVNTHDDCIDTCVALDCYRSN